MVGISQISVLPWSLREKRSTGMSRDFCATKLESGALSSRWLGDSLNRKHKVSSREAREPRLHPSLS